MSDQIITNEVQVIQILTAAQQGPPGSPGSTLFVKEVAGPSILCTTLIFPNGSLTNLGSGVVQVAFAVSPPPPPPYTPSLDFSDARNSQYIALIY